MKVILFIFGFIWIVASVVSIFGLVVGFNRKQTKEELNIFYAEKTDSNVLNVVRKIIFWIAYFGFFLPITRPILGFIGGIFYFSALALLKD